MGLMGPMDALRTHYACLLDLDDSWEVADVALSVEDTALSRGSSLLEAELGAANADATLIPCSILGGHYKTQNCHLLLRDGPHDSVGNAHVAYCGATPCCLSQNKLGGLLPVPGRECRLCCRQLFAGRVNACCKPCVDDRFNSFTGLGSHFAIAVNLAV